MTNLLMNAPSGVSALLLCGTALLLTAVVHVFVTLSPLQIEERSIFRCPRSRLSRWLTGNMPSGISMFCGLLLTMLMTIIGGIVWVNDYKQALIISPVPGLLLTTWVTIASLRRQEENWLLKVMLSALTSFLLLITCTLMFLIVEEVRWKLP